MEPDAERNRAARRRRPPAIAVLAAALLLCPGGESAAAAGMTALAAPGPPDLAAPGPPDLRVIRPSVDSRGTRPSWSRAALVHPWTATVRGEVNRPGTYAVEPGDRLSSLVAKAGGFTDAASLRAAALSRKAAAASRAEELREIVRTVEAAPPAGDPRAQEERDRFLAALRALPPLGRIPVRLAHPRLMKGTPDDILLEDGDVLAVPADPGTVAVAGAVRSPGAYPARPGARWRDYLRAAGGAAADADPKKAWLFVADGRAVPLARPFVAWNPDDARWEISAFRGDPVPAAAGDTIVVPRKAAAIAWARGIPGIDALLVRIAIITGKVVAP